MYKFTSSVPVIVGSGSTLTIQDRDIEWYLDFQIDTDGIEDFTIHVPDQVITHHDEELELTKVKAKFTSEVKDFNTLAIKPQSLVIKPDGSKTLKF